MKRFFLTLFVLFAGAMLGAAGVYLALHWDQYNPFLSEAERNAYQDPLTPYLAELRRVCAKEEYLKGVMVASAQIANNKLVLRGLAARQAQLSPLHARAQSILETSKVLQAQCPAGISTEGFHVLPIHDRLSEFREGLGAEPPLQREVMRTMRLDGVAFTENGKLTFQAVSIRNSVKTGETNEILKSVLKKRLETMGVPAEVMPEIAVEVRHHANPAVVLQKKLPQDQRHQGIYLVAAWFDDKGKLQLEGIIAEDEQRTLVEEALQAFKKDPQTSEVVKAPTGAELTNPPALTTFAGDADTRALQKKLSAYARKENKEHLRHVCLKKISPQPDDSQEEGHPTYFFVVNGPLLEITEERKKVEKDLIDWLEDNLPKGLNSREPVLKPKLALEPRPSPIFALQTAIKERQELDGTLFTDAVYDEKGQLEVLARWDQDDDTSNKTLEAGVRKLLAGKKAFDAGAQKLLADEPAWSVKLLKPHSLRLGSKVLAWKEMVENCQARLAQDNSISKRIRLDRLYFTYVNKQLPGLLKAEGLFLADSVKEDPTRQIVAAVGALMVSPPSVLPFNKRQHNPLVKLQNQLAAQPTLDGTLLTEVHYRADGQLVFNGFFGGVDHKAMLTPILTKHLQDHLELLQEGSEPAIMQGWSIDGMNLGATKQNEVLRQCQGQLAAAPAASLLRRAGVDRIYFKYDEAAAGRSLAAHAQARFLTKPLENVIAVDALKAEIRQVCAKLLPGQEIKEVPLALQAVASPVYTLQKIAAADRKFDGVLLKEAFYDEDGKLKFDGLLGGPEQRQQVKDLIEARLSEKERVAIAPKGFASLETLTAIPCAPLLEEIQTQFAKDASPLLKQTRIDHLFFKYDEGKTEARLWIEGVCIYEGNNPTRDERAKKWSSALAGRLKLQGIDGYALEFDLLTPRKNPALELQDKVEKDESMDGILFRDAGFDAKGTLRIQVFTPKGQEENVRKLLKEVEKEYPKLEIAPLSPTPAGRASLLQTIVPSLLSLTTTTLTVQEKNEPFDWQQMLTDLRKRFAGSETASILQQTRIDRARFSFNKLDPDLPPLLKFKGICLRTVHEDEKTVKELLLKELRKVNVPGVKFDVNIDEIEIRVSPIYDLQAEAVLRRNTDKALNVLFERAAYGVDGNLLLEVLALEKVPAATIAKLSQDERLVPADLWGLPHSKTKAPTVLRRDFDWPAALKDIRQQFAQSADPFLRRSRFDDAFFAFSQDHKTLFLHVTGVCVHPPALLDPAERSKKWQQPVSKLIPAKIPYEPATTGLEPLLPNPSIAWQNGAASKESHDGIHFQLADFDAQGKLKLTVLLPSETERALALRIMTGTPAFAPIEEKNIDFQFWNWKEVLPKGQARLAQGDFLLHRTRLDRIFFQYEPQRGEAILHFDGVTLHPREVEPEEAARATFERHFKNLLPIELEHKRTAERIRFLASPIYTLQAEAVRRGLDGLLFADGRYDEQGKLHLIVIFGAPDQRATAQKIVEATSIDEGVIRSRDAKGQPILDLSGLAWHDILNETQHWLGRHEETLLRKTRLERGFFSYPKSKAGPDLNLKLLGIYPNKDTLKAQLIKRFDQYVRLTLTDKLRDAGPIAIVPDPVYLDDPIPALQAKVAKAPAADDANPLDGVRLDDVSFDTEKKLILHGLWTGKGQQPMLEKWVQDTLAAKHWPAKLGINFGSLHIFDTPALLHNLRIWVADQQDIDEVWLERLHFDELGKLRVKGFSTRQQDKDKVGRQLPERLPVLNSKKLPAIEKSSLEKKTGVQVVMNGPLLLTALQEAKKDEPVDLDMLTNIAQYLRDNIPGRKVCDGLRIDRCFYDVEGVFRIEGLADHMTQLDTLKPLLDAKDATFDPKRQLRQGWAAGRITVIPLHPMMVALKEALASLPEADGVTLVRAHHDNKNRLVISAHAIGKPDVTELEPILQRLLQTHKRWRLRTTAGFVLTITESLPIDLEQSKRLVNRALLLLQVTIGEARIEPAYPTRNGWWSHAWPFDDRLPRRRPTDEEYDRCLQYLDAALLHNPKDVLAWYLRGYVLQTKGRSDLTRRDFRRLVTLELADRDLRHQRILALELVQGKLRQSAYEIEQAAILDVSYGWTLRELHEPQPR